MISSTSYIMLNNTAMEEHRKIVNNDTLTGQHEQTINLTNPLPTAFVYHCDRLMLKRIENPLNPPSIVYVQGTLSERESVCKPQQNGMNRLRNADFTGQ